VSRTHRCHALNAAGIQFMLVGSFSSNFYGIARSTRSRLNRLI
jgi:hypothetical protein